MRKDHVREQLSSFKSDINATFSHGLEYVLGETNSEYLSICLCLHLVISDSPVAIGMTCHGSPGNVKGLSLNPNIIHVLLGVSNTAGAALWTLDYSLFATQVGISRLHFHEGVGYKYNFVSVAVQQR